MLDLIATDHGCDKMIKFGSIAARYAGDNLPEATCERSTSCFTSVQHLLELFPRPGECPEAHPFAKIPRHPISNLIWQSFLMLTSKAPVS